MTALTTPVQKWFVWEADMCDDVQDDMYFGPSLVGSYGTEQAAHDAVATYVQERMRQWRQEQDEYTTTISGHVYRVMDLRLVSSVEEGDTTTDTYHYEPKTEYDYTDLWERFPERWVHTEPTKGETK